jgi:hypothetical protein
VGRDTPVWQVGSGTSGRNLAPRFIKYDVAVIGPGDDGDYRCKEYDDSVVEAFAEKVQPGDLMVLRSGRKSVVAVGIVAESGVPPPKDAKRDASPSYVYLPQFGDEDGWDLQHGHRVHWFELKPPHVFPRAVFGTIPPRFAATDSPEVRHFVEEYTDRIDTTALPPLPEVKSLLGDEEVASLLFKAGLSQSAVEHTVEAIRKIRRLSDWYADREAQADPVEQETVTYMVVPLLLALGWSEQQTAIQWHKADVALFRETPRRKENCCLIVEVKHRGAGLDHAVKQARNYVKRLGLPACAKCLVTDGLKYRLVDVKESPEGEDQSLGIYINLNRVKSVQVLIQLLPRTLCGVRA